MSNKNRKPVPPIPTAQRGPRRADADRLIEKGRLKDAVKEAKLVFKDEPTDEHHRLLERAYLLRARQLLGEGMIRSAAEVAQHLLDFGPTDEAVLGELPEFLASVGLSGAAMAIAGAGASDEDRARLAAVSADQAVLHPEQDAGASAEIRDGARRVRQALEALEAGDEAGATELLRDVGRSSPFADWRLFARGLAAFRRDEMVQAEASWGRLAAGRAPWKVARGLRALAGAAPSDGASPKLHAVETRVFGEPIIGRLEQVRRLAGTGEWPELLRLLPGVRMSLRKIDPALAERLTRILLDALVKHATDGSYREAKALVTKFVAASEPLAIDPAWNRLWAFVWEGEQGDPHTAREWWEKYIADLGSRVGLPPGDRELAQAMVWRRIGEEFVNDARIQQGQPLEVEMNQVVPIRRDVVQCFEKAIALAPKHLPTYESLLNAYRDWDLDDKAAEAARRLLEAFPDHVPTLEYLVDQQLRGDDPDAAMPLVARLQAQRPLEESYRRLESTARFKLARKFALAKKYDQARAELDRAAAVSPDGEESFPLLVRRATVEYRAGAEEAAAKFIDRAVAGAGDPVTVWLALRIEAVRYKLPRAKIDAVDKTWRGFMGKKANAAAAAGMAELMCGYVLTNVAFTGRATLIKDVVAYVKRASTAKAGYTSRQLVRVCEFLDAVDKEKALRRTLIGRGLKAHRDTSYFLVASVRDEIARGPWDVNLIRAEDRLKQALRIAESSTDPGERARLPQIKTLFAAVSDALDHPLGRFGGAFGKPGTQGGFDEIFRMFGNLDPNLFNDDDDPGLPEDNW